MYTGLYALAMITTLMPHLRIGPYKEGVLIAQIQMPFHAVGRSFPYELLIIYIFCTIYLGICTISRLRMQLWNPENVCQSLDYSLKPRNIEIV